jgi:AhpD family alkylhydroperoxidase
MDLVMYADYKIELSPVSDNDATGVAKEIIESTKANLGFVPNMYRTMANSGGYLSTYAHGYNAFRQTSGFTPIEQELVFLVLSRENGCDYCTAAHSMIADKVSKLDADTLAAVRSGAVLVDEKLEALVSLKARIFKKRGQI